MKKPIRAINIDPLPEPQLSPATFVEQLTSEMLSDSQRSLWRPTFGEICQWTDPEQPDVDPSHHMDTDSDAYSGFEIAVDLHDDADGDTDDFTDSDTDADTDIDTKADTDIYLGGNSSHPSTSLCSEKDNGSDFNRTSDLVDHRLHIRIPVREEIRFITKEAKTTTRAEMSDLSAGGVFIHTDDLLEPGTRIACSFVLDDIPNRTGGVSIRATGKVIWLSRDERCGKGRGFGLEFDKISDHDRAAISRMVDLLYVTTELRSLEEKDDERDDLVPDSWRDRWPVRAENPFASESTPASASQSLPAIDMGSLPPVHCWEPEDSGVVVSGEIESNHTLRSAVYSENEEALQQRQHPRVHIQLPIRFISAETSCFINGKTADLSPGGVFICTEVPLDPGSVVACGFYLDSNRDHPNRTAIIAKGKVVWTSLDSSGDKRRGFGLQFTKISDENKERITRAVQAHSAEPLAIASNGGTGKLVVVEDDQVDELGHSLKVVPPESNDGPPAEEIRVDDPSTIPFINWCADERRYVRVSVQKPVRFFIRGSSDFATAEMTDLSVGGMFLRTDTLLQPGTIIACALILHPMLDGPQKDAILVKGRVIWTSYGNENGKGRGFGIKFIKISSNSLRRIAQVVHERQGRRTATLRGW